jgi:hypothetical protein
MTTAVTPSGNAPAGWARRYPPLAGMGFVLLAVLLILPSALRAPQTNPTTTPEFAPVPPEDADQVSDVGNASSLGLGSSGIGGGGLGTATTIPPPGGPPGGGKPQPGTRKCVGDPPRQTEDPLSPPCVSTFKGDNGGATYQGVTADEVRVLFYIESGLCDGRTGGCRTAPERTYKDLGVPATGPEDYHSETLRAFQDYFNERFQTYGRFVRFFIYFPDQSSNGATQDRLADASDNYKVVTPFAVLTSLAYHGNNDPYLEAMAKRGVLNFGSFEARSASFFQRYPRLIWGYFPSVEQQAAQYASFLCTNVTPYNTSFSGNAEQNGTPRRYGILTTSDPAYPQYEALTAEVKRILKGCNANIVAEERIQNTGNRHVTNDDAAQIAAAFQERNVTTLLWMAGWETTVSKAFGTSGFRPEILLAGDRQLEGNNAGSVQYEDQTVWANAWVITNTTRVGNFQESYCMQAYREYNTTTSPTAVEFAGCRPFYNDMRQLFTGIQVAGPRLGPATIDRGFHAIPAVESTNPSVPACYYDQNDYTCIKDAMPEWWDVQASCWRMARGGRRYITGRWPSGDVSTLRGSDDACNAYDINL